MKLLQHHSKKFIAISRSGELAVVDDHGRERERYKIPYGAELSVNDGDKVESGQIVATWDPHSHPIITEVDGRIKFIELIEGVTMNRQADEMTGLSSIVVTDPKQRGAGGKELKPMIKLVDDQGNDVFLAGTNLPAQYFLPPDAIVNFEDGTRVKVGMYWREFRKKPLRLAILPVVYRVLQTCLKRVVQKIQLFLLKFLVLSASVKKPKANAA